MTIQKAPRFDHREEAKREFPSIYLTLLAITQSLTLGFLLVRSNDLFGRSKAMPPEDILQIFTSFVMVLVVWHEYVLAVLMFRWVLGISDSVLPFLLGGTQFFVVKSLGEPDWSTWFYAMTAFALVSTVAYLNMLLNSLREQKREEDGRNSRVFSVLHKWEWGMIFSFLALGIIVSFYWGRERADAPLGGVVIILGAFIAMEALRSWQWWRLVR